MARIFVCLLRRMIKYSNGKDAPREGLVCRRETRYTDAQAQRFVTCNVKRYITLSSPAQKNSEPYSLENFTVMLVEDSAYIQALMSSMLKIFGVGDIVLCENGREAMDLLTIMQARAQSRYVSQVDIVLTDWLMPGGSGEDLLRWIRTHDMDEVRFLPVIVVSGYTTEKVTHITRDMGAHEILVKPVSAGLLAARICSVIDTPRPFIETPNFFGPDRRRKDQPFDGPDRRTTSYGMVEKQI